MNVESINSWGTKRNRRHFANNSFACILLNENVLISFKISLKFPHKDSISNIQALVQVMAWKHAIIWNNNDYFIDA